jgi:hypothetical protein
VAKHREREAIRAFKAKADGRAGVNGRYPIREALCDVYDAVERL